MGALLDKLGILPQHRILSIVGSGGKTTLLYALARECARNGEKVAITTTTHIRRPSEPDFLLAEAQTLLAAGRVTAVGTNAPNGKFSMPSSENLDDICQHADRVLIEADGSRMLPIKYPNSTEPVILPCTDLVLVVAGLSALGKPLQTVCHRAAIAQEKLGLLPEEPVTPEIMAKLLLNGYGRWNPIVILNQADHEQERIQAEQAADYLRAGGLQNILITSLKQEVS